MYELEQIGSATSFWSWVEALGQVWLTFARALLDLGEAITQIFGIMDQLLVDPTLKGVGRTKSPFPFNFSLRICAVSRSVRLMIAVDSLFNL